MNPKLAILHLPIYKLKTNVIITFQGPLALHDMQYNSFIDVMHFIYTNRIPDTSDTVKLTELWRGECMMLYEGQR